MNDLGNHVLIRQQLRERLLVQYPELAEDGETLMDTLDGSSDLKEALIEAFEASERDKLFAAAIDSRIEALQARKERFKHRVETIRNSIEWAMSEAGIAKIEAPEATLSLRRSAVSVIVTDETKVPDEFMRVKEVKSIDKAALKAALELGPVDGAELSNQRSVLSVRTK